MIDHMGISACDFESSRRFYDAALTPLGVATMMEVTPEESGSYHGIGYGKNGKPFFWLSNVVHHVATDGARGTGIHIAFAAENRAAVDAYYAAAMAHGGRDNGPPGIRAHYHPTYYAPFVIDPDGFNVEAVCHAPE
jgi:catechol 2,3-dioxygenase-like lactoylglutathione lyase family enzyme